MLYKILLVDFILHISFLFGFQVFFEFPSGILNETLKPSSGLNSYYSALFELRSRKKKKKKKKKKNAA